MLFFITTYLLLVSFPLVLMASDITARHLLLGNTYSFTNPDITFNLELIKRINSITNLI